MIGSTRGACKGTLVTTDELVEMMLERESQPAVIVSRKGRIVLENAAMAALFGVPRGRSRGASFPVTWSGEDEETLAVVNRLLESTDAEARVVCREPGGGRRPVRLELQALGKKFLLVRVVWLFGGESGVSFDSVPPAEVDLVISAQEKDFGRVLSVAFVGGVAQQVSDRRCYELTQVVACAGVQCPMLKGGKALCAGSNVYPSVVAGCYDVINVAPHGQGRALVSCRRVSGEVVEKLIAARIQRQAAEAKLTEREREVLSYLLIARSAREIAKLLGISPRTVKFHQENLLRKLGAESRQDLLRILA